MWRYTGAPLLIRVIYEAMPGRIPPAFIDELLARTDIVEVIGSRLELKRSGHNHKGLCPFHGEKTPSFNVNAQKQFYYCFGCQASGHALRFVMEYEHLDFPAAVELLAAQAGMEVPREAMDARAEERQRRRKSILEILEQADHYFREQLRRHQDRDRIVSYLKGRGISGQIARDFGIGFSPPGQRNLQSALQKSNEDRDLLISAGLVREDGERSYELFRDRVMFPVRNLRGQVIAFGGRIMGDGQPKYLNSPETDVFRKGSELYGLWEARRSSRLEQLLVVEGYMDVVALAQAGINNAVATLGTATTGDHIERLFNQVPEVVFCFDGDTAGNNAAWKALELALPAMQDGRSARFLFLPDGEDPDSVVRAEGADGFRARLESATPLADVLFARLTRGRNLADPAARAALAKEGANLLHKLPEGVYRELLWHRLGEQTGLEARQVAQLHQREESPRAREMSEQGPGPARRRRRHPTADKIAANLLRYPELVDEIGDEQLRLFETSETTALITQLAGLIQADESALPRVLLRQIADDSQRQWLSEALSAERLLRAEDMRGELRGSIASLVNEMKRFQKQQDIRSATGMRWEDMSEEDKSIARGMVQGGDDEVPF